MADLSLQGISKTYASGVHALWPTDLKVNNGSLVVLVGPSGCGKSTLLKIIAGLEQATTGSIFLDGAQVDAVAPMARDVAMVFQSYALYPHLTVRQNIEFGLKMRGVPSAKRKEEVDAVGSLLELDLLMERRPAQLSGGQQQRVALGRAIVRRPKVFLLDEPFSNLDATLRAGTRTELLRLHRQLNATTVLVTHDQVEAMTMADVLVVMKDGRVQQAGHPLEVYRDPANSFVAQFIGLPPMNLLPAAIVAGGTVIEIAGQRCPNPFPSWKNGLQFTLGLRAEHIRPAAARESGQFHPGFAAKLAILEPLGHETIATCFVGGQDVKLRLPPATTFHPGQELQLTFRPGDAIFFDRETGVRIASAHSSLQPASGDALHKETLQSKK